MENILVESLPVKISPVKSLSKSDQNGKLTTGKLSTDKVVNVFGNWGFGVVKQMNNLNVLTIIYYYLLGQRDPSCDIDKCNIVVPYLTYE